MQEFHTQEKLEHIVNELVDPNLNPEKNRQQANEIDFKPC